MTIQNLACNKFETVYTNKSNDDATLNLSVTNDCGGIVIVGIYDLATHTQISSEQLQSGLNTIPVPAHQFVAVYCKSTDGGAGDGCTADYTVS
jgi:hypothetical protein